VGTYLGGRSHRKGGGVSEDNGVVLTGPRIVMRRGGDAHASLEAYEDYLLEFDMTFPAPQNRIGITVTVRDDEQRVVSSICSPEEGIGWRAVRRHVHVEYALPCLPLMPGKYSLDVAVYGMRGCVAFEEALVFEVQPTVGSNSTAAYSNRHGLFRLAMGGCAMVDGLDVDAVEEVP